MARKYWSEDFLPFTVMLSSECSIVGLNILFKAASLKGLSYYAFILYTYALSTLVLLPFPFIFRSSAGVPALKRPLICRIFLLGLIGVLADVLGYKSIELSSPTLASAMGNLVPAFTFTLAVIFRMERLDLRGSSTQAKIIGTIVSICGALVVTLYKGPTVLSTSLEPSDSLEQPLGSSQSSWITGGLLLATEYLLVSIWYIIQTQVMKIYPAEVIVVFLFSLCGTIIAAPVCFIAEVNFSAWRLSRNIALVAVIYAGFFGYGLSSLVHTWGIRLKGPVYIATFKPLSIAIAAIMSFIFLGDALHLGSVIGAVIISVGFYAVLWGKANEVKTNEEQGFSSFASSSAGKTQPLLESH